jgi:hypothetical protein
VLLASRARYAPENYELLVKWIKKGDAYVNDFAIQDVEGRANYDKFKTEAGPFFARANKLISEMLLPALRDGQAALVIDAKLKSKLHPLVPTEEPLPVLQMALVWGVSDAALLTKAFVEGAGLVNSIAAKLHEIEPEQAASQRSRRRHAVLVSASAGGRHRSANRPGRRRFRHGGVGDAQPRSSNPLAQGQAAGG